MQSYNIYNEIRKEHDKNNLHIVYCVYRDLYGDRFRINLFKVRKDQWNDQIVINHPSATEFNKKNIKIKNWLLDQITKIQEERGFNYVPIAEEIKNLRKKKNDGSDILLESMKKWNAASTKSQGHKNSFRALITKIEKMEEVMKKDFVFSDIDIDWFTMFCDLFLSGKLNTKKKIKPTNNTLKAYVALFIGYLRKQFNKGIYGNKDFLLFRDFVNDNYKVVVKDVQPLTIDEIKKWIDYKPENRKYGLIRLLGIIQMSTGMRYSAAMNIEPDDLYEIDGKSYVSYYEDKPENNESMEIEKEVYDEMMSFASVGPIFKDIEGFIYRDLRILSKKIGLNRVVTSYQRRGLDTTKTHCPLFSIIGTHTFRYTHSSLHLEGGGNLRELQSKLGHSSIVMTEKYAKRLLRVKNNVKLFQHSSSSD